MQKLSLMECRVWEPPRAALAALLLWLVPEQETEQSR